jgi:hypothetical protein
MKNFGLFLAFLFLALLIALVEAGANPIVKEELNYLQKWYRQ